ncbi:hypothetical protein ACWGJQ_21990 [Peribacillus simplex]
MSKIDSIESKNQLLETGSYEPVSHVIIRKVFPRIIRDAHAYYAEKAKKEGKKRASYLQIRDIVPFYLYVQTYLNNQKDRDVYGTSFRTYKDITEDLCIDAHRIKWLGDILEANGLLTKENVRRGTGRQVKYSPRYFINVSKDGYVVDENGQRIVPKLTIYDPPKKG